ncbi:MAG: alcohol dehydrogenase catalytic domain-containing protein [Candidatus Nitrosocosmicus sp.]
MKAAIFESPNNINIIERQVWEPPKGFQLLKVLSCSVCSYDVRVYRTGSFKVKPPIILGHEISAETTSAYKGKNIELKPNTRVCIYPIIPCLQCWYCENSLYNLCSNLTEIGSTINGGFAEYILIPNKMFEIEGVVPIPDSISNEEASLIEPLACCINGINQVKLQNINKNITIIGDGPIGIMQLKLLLLKFPDSKIEVIGKIPKRLEIAINAGATKATLFDEKEKETEEEKNMIKHSEKKESPNLVFVSNNNPKSLDFALNLINRNGQLMIFSGIKNIGDPQSKKMITIDPNVIHYNQITITGSFSSVPENLTTAIDLVSTGKIDLKDLITHRFSLDNLLSAIKSTEEFNGLKSVINKF